MGKLKVRDAGAIAAVESLETAIEGIEIKTSADVQAVAVGGQVSGTVGNIAHGATQRCTCGDVIKTSANVQAVSVGGNFSGTVGNISHGTTQRCSHSHTEVHTGSYTQVWTDATQVYCKANGVNAWYVNTSGHFNPYVHNSRNLGQTSLAWAYVYYCNLSDQSCADFSHLSLLEIYNLFKLFKPVQNDEIHRFQDKVFPHIDFKTVPREFAHVSEEKYTRPILRLVNDQVIDDIENIEIGDHDGIDMGGLVYAMKDMLVKTYEYIVQLEARIQVLESK